MSEIDVCSIILFHDIILTFRLFINLKIKCCKRFFFNFQCITQKRIIFKREQEVTINNDKRKKFMISNYLFNEHIRQIFDFDRFDDRYVMIHFRKMINHDENVVIFD